MAAIYTNAIKSNTTNQRLCMYYQFIPGAPSISSPSTVNAQTSVTVSSTVSAPSTGSFYIVNIRGRRTSSNSYDANGTAQCQITLGTKSVSTNAKMYLNTTATGAMWQFPSWKNDYTVPDVPVSTAQTFNLTITKCAASINGSIFNRNDSSGTLYLNLGTTQTTEYSKDNSTWQSSNVFSNLTPNTTYTFYIRSRATSASGDNSDYAYANVQGKTTGNKPTNLSISTTAHSVNSISVSYSASADSGTPITNYTLYYKKSSDANYSSINMGTTTSKQITGLTSDQNYNIYFTATNSVGTTTSSTITYSTLNSTPSVLDISCSNATPTSLRLNVNASGYYLNPLEYIFSSDNGATWKQHNRNLFDISRWSAAGVIVAGGASATISGGNITFTAINNDTYTDTYHMTSSSPSERNKAKAATYGAPVIAGQKYGMGYNSNNANASTEMYVFWYDVNWNYLSHASTPLYSGTGRSTNLVTAPTNAVYASFRLDNNTNGQTVTFSNIYFGIDTNATYVAHSNDTNYYDWTGLTSDTNYYFITKVWSISHSSYAYSTYDISSTLTHSTMLTEPTVTTPVINHILPDSMKSSVGATITPTRTLSYKYGIWTNKNSELDLTNADPDSYTTIINATTIQVVKNTSGQTWSSAYVDISNLLEDKTWYKISTGNFSISGGSSYTGAVSIAAQYSPSGDRVWFRDVFANRELCFYTDFSSFPFYYLYLFLTNDTAGTGSTTGVFNNISFQKLQYNGNEAYVYEALKENTTYYLATGVRATHTGSNSFDTFQSKTTTATTTTQSPIVKIKKNFPNNYTQLSYIQCSGTQYIDSGIYGSNIGEIITKFNCNTIGSGWESICFSENHTVDDKWPGCGIRINNGTTFYPQWGNKYLTLNTFSINTDYEIDFNVLKQKIKINGVNYNTTVPRGEYEAPDYNVYIFANNSVGSVSQYASGFKLYYLKFYDMAGNLLRDFIPAKRNSDNEVGLYDLISDTFFTNLGTGTFTAGSSVTSISKWIRGIPKIKINGNWVDAKQCYIKNSGNWTKAKIDKYDNFCYWKYWKESDYGSRWNITYDNELELNCIVCAGNGGWEELYYPFATESGSIYRITFDYFNPNGYTPLSGYTGIPCQALRSLPTDSDERANSNVINEILLSPLTNVQTQRLTFNFTAVGDVTYINYNYGLAADGVTTTIWLGNFTIEKIS